MEIFWIIFGGAGAMIALGAAWWFIFHAAMRDRNDHGEFGYRDIQ
jgi:hypothetical protein